MRQWYPIGLSCLITLLFQTCTPNTPDLTPGFYHWKQTFAPSKDAWGYLDSINAGRLYIRLFDVAWDPVRSIPIPQSIVDGKAEPIPDYLDLVAVIFLTEDAMERIRREDVPQLADQMSVLIRELESILGAPAEYQLDCDWTPGSRDSYFQLIDEMKSRVGAPVSVTLRLHQLRFPEKTGIPPADRVILMYYNMGEVTDPATTNSILDISIGRSYLEKSKIYPLPMDLALPLFRWGVVFREGYLISLINELSAADLIDSTRFEALSGTQFRVRKDTYLQGYYLYAGDQIRLERVLPVELARAAAQWASMGLIEPDGNLVFYHLDEPIRKIFPHEVLRPVLKVLAPSAID